MRKQFLGHFKETDETVSELWKTATFVFDANVLLNLYRYSDETRTEFIALLVNLKDRAWLPEQAAEEFLKNRASVIKSQIGSYDSTQSDIGKLRKSFSGSRAHPFISKNAKKRFEAAVEKINGEMEKNKLKQEELIYKDSIKEQIADLFDGRVGAAYADDDLNNIFEQGEERYAAKVPPGYKDGKKHPDAKSESDKRSNFGDWIIWKQVMDYATSANAPVILVTDDRKEDWWLEESGKTLGPRPELINEFSKTTGQKILIYKPDSFLTISKEQLDIKISNNSINEVEAEHFIRETKRLTEEMRMWRRKQLEIAQTARINEAIAAEQNSRERKDWGPEGLSENLLTEPLNQEKRTLSSNHPDIPPFKVSAELDKAFAEEIKLKSHIRNLKARQIDLVDSRQFEKSETVRFEKERALENLDEVSARISFLHKMARQI